MTEAPRTLDPAQRVTSWAVIRLAILRDVEGQRPRMGFMLCPRCETGSLFYSVTKDGTVSGTCETTGCVAIDPPSLITTPPLPMSWSARSAPREEET